MSIVISRDPDSPEPGYFIIDLQEEKAFVHHLNTAPYKGSKCITPLPEMPTSSDSLTNEKLMSLSFGDTQLTGAIPFYYLIVDSKRGRIDLITDYHSRIPFCYNDQGIYFRHSGRKAYASRFVSSGHSTFCVEPDTGKLVVTNYISSQTIIPHLSHLMRPPLTPESDFVERFLSTLREAVQEQLRGVQSLRVLTSGGIDSTILAYICAEHVEQYGTCRINLCNIRFTETAKDVAAFEALCQCPKLESVRREHPLLLSFTNQSVSEKTFRANLINVKELIVPCPPTVMALNLGSIIYHLTRSGSSAMESDTHVMSGLGPDEYCGAYAAMSKSDMTRWKDATVRAQHMLFERNITRESGVFRDVLYPYLAPRVTGLFSYLMETERYELLRDKEILRRAALVLGVPQALARRPKQAAQFGSGCAKILKGSGYDVVDCDALALGVL